MRDYSNELGETLVKLCKLSRQHNVDIRIRQVPGDFTGNRFELQLDRGDCHAVETVDITPTLNIYPSSCMEYAFERAKYSIKQLQMEEKK